MSLTALRYFSRAGGGLKHSAEQLAVSDFIRLFNIKTPGMDQTIGLLSGAISKSRHRARTDDAPERIDSG